MERRQFLAGSAALAVSTSIADAQSLSDIPIVDTHIHLFDSRRPQGVPYYGSAAWRKETGGVALPATYRAMAEPLKIVAAIELEGAAGRRR